MNHISQPFSTNSWISMTEFLGTWSSCFVHPLNACTSHCRGCHFFWP